MPSPEDKVLAALKAKQHDEMIRLIKEHPQLINMEVEKVKSSLMSLIVRAETERPLELIKEFVTHPDFNFGFVNRNGYTNFDALLEYGRLDVLNELIDNPNILVINGQSSYERATIFQKLIEAEIAELKEGTPSTKLADKKTQRVNNLKQMIVMLREAMIKQAIVTDDPSYLDMLEKAGDDLNHKLSTGMMPYHSLRDNNDNLYAWFEGYFARTDKKDESLSKLPQRFFSFAEGEQQLQELKQKHLERRAQILDEAAEAREKRMEELSNLMRNK